MSEGLLCQRLNADTRNKSICAPSTVLFIPVVVIACESNSPTAFIEDDDHRLRAKAKGDGFTRRNSLCCSVESSSTCRRLMSAPTIRGEADVFEATFGVMSPSLSSGVVDFSLEGVELEVEACDRQVFCESACGFGRSSNPNLYPSLDVSSGRKRLLSSPFVSCSEPSEARVRLLKEPLGSVCSFLRSLSAARSNLDRAGWLC